MSRRLVLTASLLLSLLAPVPGTMAGELLVGAASVDVTPAEPVALSGQFHVRVSQKVETPITANVVALESRAADRPLDAAVMVSCDFVGIRPDILEKVRQATHRRLPDLDTQKIFLSATHTHTAPVPGADPWYKVPETGVMQVETYASFFVERVAEAIQQAWKGRKTNTLA